MSPSSTVLMAVSMILDASKDVIFVWILRAGFVAYTTWGDRLEPARTAVCGYADNIQYSSM